MKSLSNFNFELPDLSDIFSLDKVNDWLDFLPDMSYSFESIKDLFSDVFSSQAELSNNLQSYVSQLTGIQIADVPYTINTFISDFEGIASGIISKLTTDDLATVNYSGDITIDSLLDNSINWNYLNPVRNVLYYTFDIKNFDDTSLTTSKAVFNSVQQDAVRTILTYANSITGIQFEEVTSGQNADIHFANTNLDGKSTAGLCDNLYSYNPTSNGVSNYIADSYVYLDDVEWSKENSNPLAGTQGYETLLHEIGHALGLKHPFETPKVLPDAQDNTNNTVMSYEHKGGDSYKSTFQSYDLAALKWIYGGDGLGGIAKSSVVTAKLLYATVGDDYLLGSNKNEKIKGLAGNDTLDGGAGRDTLTGGDGNDIYIVDNTGDKIIETSKIDIDSVQSSVNFTLPKYVEHLTLTGNAKTATGNELANKLVGNVLTTTLNGMAGNDTLEGGKGNDKLVGGSGKDIFVFNSHDYDFVGDFAPRAQNLDTITDFTKGADIVQLSAAFAFKGFIVVDNLKQSIGEASLIYDNATRALYFDADGLETHYEPTKFIQFSGRVNLDKSDLQFIDESLI